MTTLAEIPVSPEVEGSPVVWIIAVVGAVLIMSGVVAVILRHNPAANKRDIDTNDRPHTIARWIFQGPFDLRLSTTTGAIAFALITWRTWPSAYAAVAAGIATIYAVIAGVAIATGKSDLYQPGTND